MYRYQSQLLSPGRPQGFQTGQYVYAQSPAGYRRLARIVSPAPDRRPRARRELWLVVARNAVRWEKPMWLPVERALLEGELELQRTLGFIDAKGEPS
jgi:hypothetical protein